MNVSFSGAYNKANIFLGLIEYELNSLLGASHLVDYIYISSYSYSYSYLLNSSPVGLNKVRNFCE